MVMAFMTWLGMFGIGAGIGIPVPIMSMESVIPVGRFRARSGYSGAAVGVTVRFTAAPYSEATALLTTPLTATSAFALRD